MCIDIQNWSEVCLETHRFSRNHYRLVPTTVNMERFTHDGMADMHLVYGSVNGNGRVSAKESWEAPSGIDGSSEVALWPGHPGHLTSRVWISSSRGIWSGWCMKQLWKQKSLELPSLLEPLRTCHVSSNRHDNPWSDDVLQRSRIRAVPVNATSVISMLKYFLCKSSLASKIAVRDHVYHNEIYLFWRSLLPVLIWTNSFGTLCIYIQEFFL